MTMPTMTPVSTGKVSTGRTGKDSIFDLTVTERCHLLLADHLYPGDTAIDCTCGNGNDTLFLCRSVGMEGRVYAFDIQEQAIKITEALLKREGFEAEFFLCSHRLLEEQIKNQSGPAPAVIMYNLGYLPGADHGFTTRTEETIASLQQALVLLKKGGLISVITYPGHEEGQREACAVRELLRGLSKKNFEVLTITQTNRSDKTPVLHLIHKR